MKGYQEYLYRRDEISEEILKESIGERKELLCLVRKEHRWLYCTLIIRMILSPMW